MYDYEYDLVEVLIGFTFWIGIYDWFIYWFILFYFIIMFVVLSGMCVKSLA